MKHKNCIKCGKKLKTAEGQQSGIGPECKKSVSKKFLLKFRKNENDGFVDGEVRWLLEENDYDVVFLCYARRPYWSSDLSVAEIHWMDDSPPFHHTLKRKENESPPLAFANLLEMLGYTKTTNNHYYIMEEVWRTHEQEWVGFEGSGTGKSDDFPLIIDIKYLEPDDGSYFQDASEQNANSMYNETDWNVSDTPEMFPGLIHIFGEDFRSNLVMILDKAHILDYSEPGESLKHVHATQNLWQKMRNTEHDYLYNCGENWVPNPIYRMKFWLNENIANYAEEFLRHEEHDEEEEEGTQFKVVITAKNREKLLQDALKQIEQMCEIKDDMWAFNGWSPPRFFWLHKLMIELWIPNVLWESDHHHYKLDSNELDEFIQEHVENLNKNDISLPTVETWH